MRKNEGYAVGALRTHMHSSNIGGVNLRVVGHCPQKPSFEGSHPCCEEGILRAVVFDWIRL